MTIIDDDRPGSLAFETTKVRQPANDSHCCIRVQRLHDFDGQITVNYRTVQIDESSSTATPGIDYVEHEGTLVFGNGEAKKEIRIEIIQRELEEDEERNEIFGV